MASFNDVISISTTRTPSIDRTLLQLTIAGSSEVLTLSFASLGDAEAVAILIDGYSMLVHQNLQARWRSMIDVHPLARATIPPPFLGPHPSEETSDSYTDQDTDDYAEVLSPDYQIDRKQIQMIESLGNGQFGEVYRGILKLADQQLELNIAIKTCKMQDIATTEAFLEEACTFSILLTLILTPSILCRCDAKVPSSTHHQIDRRLYGTACSSHHGIGSSRRVTIVSDRQSIGFRCVNVGRLLRTVGLGLVVSRIEKIRSSGYRRAQRAGLESRVGEVGRFRFVETVDVG